MMFSKDTDSEWSQCAASEEKEVSPEPTTSRPLACEDVSDFRRHIIAMLKSRQEEYIASIQSMYDPDTSCGSLVVGQCVSEETALRQHISETERRDRISLRGSLDEAMRSSLTLHAMDLELERALAYGTLLWDMYADALSEMQVLFTTATSILYQQHYCSVAGNAQQDKEEPLVALMPRSDASCLEGNERTTQAADDLSASVRTGFITGSSSSTPHRPDETVHELEPLSQAELQDEVASLAEYKRCLETEVADIMDLLVTVAAEVGDDEAEMLQETEQAQHILQVSSSTSMAQFNALLARCDALARGSRRASLALSQRGDSLTSL